MVARTLGTSVSAEAAGRRNEKSVRQRHRHRSAGRMRIRLLSIGMTPFLLDQTVFDKDIIAFQLRPVKKKYGYGWTSV